MKAKNLAAIVLVAIAVLLLVWAFDRLPIEDSGLAIDWKQIWTATHGFEADYANTELRTPPWALPVIWVFTLFPLNISWGLAACATLAVLVISVPRQAGKRKWLLGVALLASSYPALRQLVDGNLEALVIGGVLLLLWAAERKNVWVLAAGILLAAAKIQETWLLIILLGFWLLRQWPPRQLFTAAGLAIGFAAPFLIWKGGEWLNAMLHFPWPGTAIDSSLGATLARLGAPNFLYWILWVGIFAVTIYVVVRRGPQVGRIEAGLLLATGLLLGPYAASNSVLVPLAIGVVPLLQRKVSPGIGLLALFNLPYLALNRIDLRVIWESNYWTAVLLITWMALAISLFRSDPSREVA